MTCAGFPRPLVGRFSKSPETVDPRGRSLHSYSSWVLVCRVESVIERSRRKMKLLT